MEMIEQPSLFSVSQSRISQISDSFGYWLSGLFDGEGSLIVEAKRRVGSNGFAYNYCRAFFHIGLRDDDGHVLEYIQATLGCGGIVHRPNYERSNPCAQYRIYRPRDLYQVVVPLLDKYPLQSKKRLEWPHWKRAVKLLYDRGCVPQCKYSPGELMTLHFIVGELKKIRAYDPTHCTLGAYRQKSDVDNAE